MNQVAVAARITMTMKRSPPSRKLKLRQRCGYLHRHTRNPAIRSEIKLWALEHTAMGVSVRTGEKWSENGRLLLHPVQERERRSSQNHQERGDATTVEEVQAEMFSDDYKLTKPSPLPHNAKKRGTQILLLTRFNTK
jgi:hypothetical protein